MPFLPLNLSSWAFLGSLIWTSPYIEGISVRCGESVDGTTDSFSSAAVVAERPVAQPALSEVPAQ